LILPVQLDADPDLAKIVGAITPAAPFVGAIEGRKEHARQDGNNGNHHQQLNQREPFPLPARANLRGLLIRLHRNPILCSGPEARSISNVPWAVVFSFLAQKNLTQRPYQGAKE
jgi:hypothetical protein